MHYNFNVTSIQSQCPFFGGAFAQSIRSPKTHGKCSVAIIILMSLQIQFNSFIPRSMSARLSSFHIEMESMGSTHWIDLGTQYLNSMEVGTNCTHIQLQCSSNKCNFCFNSQRLLSFPPNLAKSFHQICMSSREKVPFIYES